MVRDYGCMGVCDFTPLPAYRVPALHTTQTLIRAKGAALQTRRMCTLTEPLKSKNTHPIFFVVWVHAFVEKGTDFLCGGVCTHQ